MNLRSAIENYYSKLSIICDYSLGKVSVVENYIPNDAVEKFAEKILKGFSENYNVDNCVTEIIKQPFGELKIEPIVKFQLNDRAKALKEDLHRRSNRWTNPPSMISNFGTLARDFCIIVLAYQSLKMLYHLRNRNIVQAKKHGINAIITGIILLILANTLLRL